MGPRQRFSEPMGQSVRKYGNIPIFVSELIRAIVEVPFWLFLLALQMVRDSPVIQECYEVFIEFSIRTLQRILQDPTIQETISTTISEGMNIFIEQPNLDQLLLHMVTSISKSQPDIARQQGQDFPIVVSSFVQGIIQHAVNRKSPQKVSHHPGKNNSSIQADEAGQHLKPQQISVGSLSSPQIDSSTADIETRSIGNFDTGHLIDTPKADEALPNVTTGTSTHSNEPDETLNDHLIIATSSSSSSMITATATTPTTQYLRSDENENYESSDTLIPLAQADKRNDSLLQIDDACSDLNGISTSSLDLPTDDSMLLVRGSVVPQLPGDISDSQAANIPIADSNQEDSVVPFKPQHGPSLLQFPFFGRPR